jgi:hypothetical protein
MSVVETTPAAESAMQGLENALESSTKSDEEDGVDDGEVAVEEPETEVGDTE